jgi:pimeloyl-ACP methyl ester carboxylesterase
MLPLLFAVAMTCVGRGVPVVVIESGFDEHASDWAAVQKLVAKHTRICAYDRAAGPLPRTFAQINLELKDALEKAHERGPFVLAGHSFGGPVVRSFAELYPQLVAGMVLIDATHEAQRVFYGGAYHSLREGATGREIPPPHIGEPKLDGDAGDSEREWSSEYFARWLAHPQTGLLGSKPLAIIARNARDLGGTTTEADVARERVLLQLSLASLSENATVTFVGFDHDMQKTMPGVVAESILSVVRAVRRR